MLPQFQNGSRITLIFPKTSSMFLSKICSVTGKGLDPAPRLEALLKRLFLLLRSKSQQAILTKYAQNRGFLPSLFQPSTHASQKLGFFPGSHLFLSPHSKEVTEMCPSCLLLQTSPSAPSPAPARLRPHPLASGIGELAPA